MKWLAVWVVVYCSGVNTRYAFLISPAPPPPAPLHTHTHTHTLQSIGVVSLAIGLWLYIANNEYATFSAGAHLYGSVFLIGVGFGITIVGFLGIVAAIWESVIISTAVSLTSSTVIEVTLNETVMIAGGSV